MITNRSMRLAIVFTFVFALIRLDAQDFHAVSSEVAQHIASSGRKSVAVTDFTDLEGKPTKLGRYLAEEFSTALLSNAKGFDVIDRTHLNSLLQEHKLATTGLIDPATVRKLGQIVWVETLVTGTMTPFEEYVHLTLKVIDTETAKMVAAANYDVPKTKTISDLIGSQQGPASSTAPNSTNGPSAAQPSTAAAMPPEVNNDEISFAPRGCRNTGSITTCIFSITNNADAAHHLTFQWMTFLVDDLGDQYQQPRLIWGSGDTIPGIPMNLSIEAPNVPGSARLMNASLSYQIDWGRKDGKVMIRNIPISQR